jgi:hypothetical protein
MFQSLWGSLTLRRSLSSVLRGRPARRTLYLEALENRILPSQVSWVNTGNRPIFIFPDRFVPPRALSWGGVCFPRSVCLSSVRKLQDPEA